MSYRFAGIDHVQLACPRGSEEQARLFYREVLGMPEITKPQNLRARGGVWFQCGRHQVHLGVQDDFRPALKAHPAFEVSPIDVLRNHLLKQGIKVMEDDARETCERFYVNDPFGNRIEFLEWRTSNTLKGAR